MEKKNNPTSGKMEDMMAYVDENGNLTTVSPDEREEKEESAKPEATSEDRVRK